MDRKIISQNATIDRFLNLCEGVMNMPEPNINKGFLQGKNKIISEMWKKIDTTHDILMEGIDDDAKVALDYFVKNEYTKAFKVYDKVTVKIQTKLEKFKSPTQQLPPIQLPENLVLNAVNNKSNIYSPRDGYRREAVPKMFEKS